MPGTYDATTKVGFNRPTMQEYEEHSKVGDASTGRPIKYVQSAPLLVMVDEASDTVQYIGEAVPNASSGSALWRIRKVLVSGTTTSVQFADGDDNFDNIWDNRDSLTYS